MYTEENLQRLLDEVIDPELGIGIYSLGLIYTIDIHGSEIKGSKPTATDITMTFTSPFCPYADAILEQVENVIILNGFGTSTIQVTFDPVWEPKKELRTVLGL